MQPPTLAAVGAMILAAGFLLIGTAVDSPGTRAKHHRTRTPAGSDPGNPSAEACPRFRERHPERPAETSDPFREQARQIAAMPPDTDRESAVRYLAQEWAKTAPAAAERWARALQDPAERESALTHVCLEVAGRDPREAIRIAGSNHLHQGTVEAILGRWATLDFEGASSWTGALPDGELRDRVLMQLVLSRAGDAPDEAAALLSERPLSGKAQEEAAIAVLHQWLLKDPEAARQWVELFPEGPLKDRATGELQETAHRGSRGGD